MLVIGLILRWLKLILEALEAWQQLSLLGFIAGVYEVTETTTGTSDSDPYTSDSTTYVSTADMTSPCRCHAVDETIPAWCIIGWILFAVSIVGIIGWFTLSFIVNWYCKKKCFRFRNGKYLMNNPHTNTILMAFSKWTWVSRLTLWFSFSVSSEVVHPLGTGQNFSYPHWHHPTAFLRHQHYVIPTNIVKHVTLLEPISIFTFILSKPP